jgi:large subunit ribosomal protein L3
VELGAERQRTARDSRKGERTPRGRRATLAEVGHAKKAGLDYAPGVLRSFRVDDAPGRKKGAPVEDPGYKLGDLVKVDIFTVGEEVKVTGTSKGRGFQGIVKRHGAGGGPNTHGNTKHRRPGSIGPGTDPSRVIKGKRMPGQYGNKRHTQQNLRVEKIDAERHLIYIRGAVAGPRNGLVVVRKQA